MDLLALLPSRGLCDACHEGMRGLPMKGAVMFSRATDEWETPQAFFDALDDEFSFELDAAARDEQVAKQLPCITPEMDALALDWRVDLSFGIPPIVFLNPPYSKCRAFIAKAAEEARKGCTVVCLVPSRTDTRWWHEHVWDGTTHQPRPGVEVRFLRGRLKFGGSKNSAPFPSVVIIFRPVGDPCS